MKKIISILTASLLLLSAISGCGNTDSSNADNTVPAGNGIVVTDGSTSMEKVIGYLSETYMEENPNTKVTYNPTGSGSGIKAVSEGRCDIGLSSRNLKDEEKESLTETVVAIDGIAIIVNSENPVNNLTTEQISALYKGEITSWSEVGGNDSPVVLIGREAASGTRDGFENITKTEDLCKYSQEVTSTGDVIQTVASNPGAIGYASFASVKDSVKILSVDNIAPSAETIQDGTYKIQRDFVFVTKKDSELSTSAKDFFDFAMSSEADDLITKAGAIPTVK